MGKIHITWTKSAIGYDQRQRDIVRALGLRRLNHTVVRDDSPSIRGMVAKISHLVKVESHDAASD